LIDQTASQQPEILETAEILTADKGYDDTKLITKCWDEHQIKPVIDIRNMWKDTDKTRLLEGQENVAYNYKGKHQLTGRAINGKKNIIIARRWNGSIAD
jgi:hypothetical protein